MKNILFVIPLLFLGLFSCEQSLTSDKVEKMTPQEIADVANADSKVVRAFDLDAAIRYKRTEAILQGAELPDGPGTEILNSSTSATELSDYLSSFGFKSASTVAELYAERNTLLVGFRVKYKPVMDMLSPQELEELNELLAYPRTELTAEEALQVFHNNK